MIEKISSNNIYVHFKSKFIDSSYYWTLVLYLS
jgi:hypothetical protein